MVAQHVPESSELLSENRHGVGLPREGMLYRLDRRRIKNKLEATSQLQEHEPESWLCPLAGSGIG